MLIQYSKSDFAIGLLGDAWDRAWKLVDVSQLPHLMHADYYEPYVHAPGTTGEAVVLVAGFVTAGGCVFWGLYLRDPGSFPREPVDG